MLINSLPKDKIPVTKEENDIVDWLFPPVEEKVEQENFEEKDTPQPPPKKQQSPYLKVFIITVIFYLLNLNVVDNLITKYSGLQNTYIVALVKTILLMIILILIALMFKK